MYYIFNFIVFLILCNIVCCYIRFSKFDIFNKGIVRKQILLTDSVKKIDKIVVNIPEYDEPVWDCGEVPWDFIVFNKTVNDTKNYK